MIEKFGYDYNDVSRAWGIGKAVGPPPPTKNIQRGMDCCFMLILFLAAILLMAGGCATETQMAVDDHRAAFSRAAADKINAGTVQDVSDNALYIAWIMENIARGDANRAARNRWEKPPFPHPAKMPTSLPYTPEDNIPQGGSTDLCK